MGADGADLALACGGSSRKVELRAIVSESRRSLSPAEVGILTEVQDFWGLRNNAREVHLTESDEAVLFVMAQDGTNPVMVNLTNFSACEPTKL